MKIEGKIEIISETAPELGVKITRSLEPDNLENIKTQYDEYSVITYFRSERIGSLISTVDDYLLNARIAADVISAAEKDNKEG